MIRGEIAVVQSALRTGQIVNFLAGFGHEPARQDFARCARRAFHIDERLAVLVAQDFPARHARDDDHHSFAVKEHFLDEVFEAISCGVILELKAHVLHELGIAKAPNRQAIGEVRLAIDDEVFAFGKFLRRWRCFPGFDFVHVPDLARKDLVLGQEAARQTPRAGHKSTTIDAQLLRSSVRHFADQLLDLFLRL